MYNEYVPPLKVDDVIVDDQVKVNMVSMEILKQHDIQLRVGRKDAFLCGRDYAYELLVIEKIYLLKIVHHEDSHETLSSTALQAVDTDSAGANPEDLDNEEQMKFFHPESSDIVSDKGVTTTSSDEWLCAQVLLKEANKRAIPSELETFEKCVETDHSETEHSSRRKGYPPAEVAQSEINDPDIKSYIETQFNIVSDIGDDMDEVKDSTVTTDSNWNGALREQERREHLKERALREQREHLEELKREEFIVTQLRKETSDNEPFFQGELIDADIKIQVESESSPSTEEPVRDVEPVQTVEVTFKAKALTSNVQQSNRLDLDSELRKFDTHGKSINQDELSSVKGLDVPQEPWKRATIIKLTFHRPRRRISWSCSRRKGSKSRTSWSE